MNIPRLNNTTKRQEFNFNCNYSIDMLTVVKEAPGRERLSRQISDLFKVVGVRVAHGCRARVYRIEVWPPDLAEMREK